MMKKKNLAIIAAVTCSVLAVFTFFSKTIYGLSLTGVQSSGVSSAHISSPAQADGVIVCTETITVTAGENWTVDSVLVEKGQHVSKGDLLLTTDTRDWELGRLAKELEILRLVNGLEALDEAHGDVKMAELYAPFDGRFQSAESTSTGRKIVQDTFLGRYVDDSAFLVSVYFIEPYKDKIRVDMKAVVTLPERMYAVEGTVTAVSEIINVVDGIRVFSVDVRIANPGSLTEETVATVELKAADSEVVLPFGPGALRYAREELLCAPMSGVVSEYHAKTGERFNEGDIILGVQEDSRSENGRAIQRSRMELAAQLEIAKRQLERYRGPFGSILAEADGYVGSVSVKDGDRPSEGAELLCIYPDGAPFEVRFTLPDVSRNNYAVGTPVSVKYLAMEADSVLERTCVSQISERRLSDDGTCFAYSAPIDEHEGYPLMNAAAEVSVNDIGVIYDVVVPASCVTDREDGKYVFILSKRQGLFGIEYYVTEYMVNVIGGNAYQTALEPGIVYGDTRVVVYASRPLKSGDVVKEIQP